MTVFSKISATGRAAIVAVLLGATTIAGAAPAQAQGVEFRFGIGGGGGGVYYDDYDDYECYSTREIRRDLRSRGYRDIEIRGSGRYVNVRARKDGYYYRIVYDACRGRIVERSRIRR